MDIGLIQLIQKNTIITIQMMRIHNFLTTFLVFQAVTGFTLTPVHKRCRWTVASMVSTSSDATSSPSAPKSSSKPIRRYRATKREPLIAIIGRPNVGKSALVNRIAGTHNGGAIVADESGITRDRTYRLANFLGENFQLVDTGGLVFDDDENTLFAKEIRQQANIAIDESK